MRWQTELKLTDVSEQHVSLIFRVGESVEEETSVNEGCKQLFSR
jgi:hypothetical protein